jgi:hypothetical protein
VGSFGGGFDDRYWVIAQVAAYLNCGATWLRKNLPRLRARRFPPPHGSRGWDRLRIELLCCERAGIQPEGEALQLLMLNNGSLQCLEISM